MTLVITLIWIIVLYDLSLANTDTEWTHVMTAGSMIVNHLNSLLVYASKRDFSFIYPPDFKFQYIKNPKSFQATAIQIVENAYSVLLGLHMTTIQIQSNSQRLSNNINTSMKLLVSNSSKIADLLLPRLLDDINRLANESVIYTRTTINRLYHLPDLMSESMQIGALTYSNLDGKTLRRRSHIRESMHDVENHNESEFDGKDLYNENIQLVKCRSLDKNSKIMSIRSTNQEIMDILRNFNSEASQTITQWNRLMIFFHKLINQIEPLQKVSKIIFYLSNKTFLYFSSRQ